MMMMMKMKHGWPGNSHVEEEDHLQTGSSIKGFSGQIPQILAVGRQETRKIMWIASGKLTQEIYIYVENAQFMDIYRSFPGPRESMSFPQSHMII